MSRPLTQDQEREVQQLARAIAAAASDEFEQLARTLLASGDAPFGKPEFTIRDILLRVGVKAYEQLLAQKKNGYEGASVTCPDCDAAAAYHADASRTLVSLFGPIRYQRAYYYCRRCGKGHYPFDQHAGIPAHQLTPADERLASLAGGVSPASRRGPNCVGSIFNPAPAEEAVQPDAHTSMGH